MLLIFVFACSAPVGKTSILCCHACQTVVQSDHMGIGNSIQKSSLFRVMQTVGVRRQILSCVSIESEREIS